MRWDEGAEQSVDMSIFQLYDDDERDEYLIHMNDETDEVEHDDFQNDVATL